MAERDLNPGGAGRPSSTYVDASNPARSVPASSDAVQPPAGLKEKANQDWQEAKSAIGGELEHVSDKAKEAASERKNFAAERVSGVGSAIAKIGAELEDGDQPEVGRYARQIGGRVQRFAEDMKGKDLGEIANMTEDFGRRQPAAFLGIAALAGFAASRFLMASATRRSGAGTSRSDNIPANPASHADASVNPAASMDYRTDYSAGGRQND